MAAAAGNQATRCAAMSSLAVPQRLVALLLVHDCLALVAVGVLVVAAPHDEVRVGEPARHARQGAPGSGASPCVRGGRRLGAASGRRAGAPIAHSFLACSSARACPKWNRSKIPAGKRARGSRRSSAGDRGARNQRAAAPLTISVNPDRPIAFLNLGLLDGLGGVMRSGPGAGAAGSRGCSLFFCRLFCHGCAAK